MCSASNIDWNAYACHYDLLNLLQPYRRLLIAVVQLVKSADQGPILDAGCGTGNLLALLHAHGCRELMGADNSAEMLARAKQKCPNVQFIQADLATLPFAPETFAAITCINVLYGARDPGRSLRTFRRLLKDGGRLILVTPRCGYENGLILKAHCKSNKPDAYWRGMHVCPARELTLLYEAFADESIVEQMQFIAEVNRQIAAQKRFHFFTKKKLMALMRQAQFSIERCERIYAGQSHLLVARKR